jgi:hypothetical protein
MSQMAVLANRRLLELAKRRIPTMTPVKVRRYPILNTRIVVLISVPVIVTITLLVFVLSTRSMLVESQITVGIISLCLFIFLTTGLYRGVRLERPGKDELDRSIRQFDSRDESTGPRWNNFFNILFAFGPPDLPRVELPHLDIHDMPDVGDDLVGCLVTLVLWIGVLILIMILLWLLTQVIAALPVIAVVLYWIFYRALRVVFAKSRACRGRLLQSAAYGLLYTLVYTGWIFALLSIARFLIHTA